MLQPRANIVITVFPADHKIFVDFAVPIVESVTKLFEELEKENLGICCYSRPFPESGIGIIYTRVWDGTEIVKEIRLLLNSLGFSSVHCQIEGDFITSKEISFS